MLKLENVHIEYGNVLLENASMNIYPSRLTLIKGRSGTGKSTLLYRIGLIHPIIDYDYYIEGKNIIDYKESKIVSIRKNRMAYVLQDSLLFDHYNVLENLRHACMINEVEKTEEELLCLLHEVHLDISLKQRMNQISGGERQRLQIACALCKEPKILILDEPTSALDIENERAIFELLKNLARSRHIYIVAASHSYIADEYADTIYEIKDKCLVKVKSISNDERVSLKKEKTLNIQFFSEYIRHFRRSYRFMYQLIIGVLILTNLLTCGIYQVVEMKMEDNRQLLDRISFNQLVITNDKNKIHVDDYEINEYRENIDLYDRLNSMEEVKNVYSLYSYKTNIYGLDIYLLPIYKENDFQQQCFQVNKHRTDNPKVLLKATIYNSLVNLLMNEKQMILNFVEKENVYDIIGLLRQNYMSPYLKHSSNYIYIDYKVIEEIAVSIGLKPIGYTIFCDDLESLENAEEKLVEIGYGVNNSFQKGRELRDIQKRLEKIRNRVIEMICVVSVSFLVLLFSHYINLRKKEFALLKVNGLGERDILEIMKRELIYLNVRGCIIPIIIMIGLIIIIYKKITIEIIVILFIVMMIQMLITYLLNKHSIASLSPEEILRN